MIFAPLRAASSTRAVSFRVLAFTAPRSEEHWTAATFTVRGRGRGAAAFARMQTPSQAITAGSIPIAGNSRRGAGMLDLSLGDSFLSSGPLEVWIYDKGGRDCHFLLAAAGP